MVNIVIVEKSGSSIDKNVKKLKLDDLYKKCNFRKNSDFQKIHTFKVNTYYVHVYGKDQGKSNQVNKFEYPPPIDTKLFFGNMALVKSDTSELSDGNMIDYTAAEWNNDYETLMGGFEDIGSTSDTEEDELDNYPSEQITKEGYLKDGFVVQDIEESVSDSEDVESYKNESDSGYEESSYESESELSEEEYDSE